MTGPLCRASCSCCIPRCCRRRTCHRLWGAGPDTPPGCVCASDRRPGSERSPTGPCSRSSPRSRSSTGQGPASARCRYGPKKGERADRPELHRPREPGLQVPPAHRPQRPAPARSRPGRQHPRQPALRPPMETNPGVRGQLRHLVRPRRRPVKLHADKGFRLPKVPAVPAPAGASRCVIPAVGSKPRPT